MHVLAPVHLTLDALTLSRGDRTLTRNLTAALHPGEAVALVGPNGSGKTTLLRAVAGLIRPDSGALRFSQRDSTLDPDDARQRLHWLGWQDGQRSGRTARAEARFWSAWCGGSDRTGDEALEALGLAAAAAELDVRRLSAGQRRRLALTRLLSAPRTLWLLDEPLSVLDVAWRRRLGELMAAHLAEGGSILAAVHDPLPIPAREISLGEPG